MQSSSGKPKISGAMSIAVHQLKNPVSILRGYLEILISEDLGKINRKQREYLEDALENVKRMSRIVGYLLDISRIEEGEYVMKPEPMDLGRIAFGVVKSFSVWAKASNCKISLKRPKGLPRVLADPLRIRGVIENIISNSLKYRPVGVGKIEIFLEQKGNEVLFCCKDNGIGIAKGEFKRVFTKFYRSEEAVKADPLGTGLGLHINQAIIELSRGKIWFAKNKDAGMSFYFTLPVAKN